MGLLDNMRAKSAAKASGREQFDALLNDALVRPGPETLAALSAGCTEASQHWRDKEFLAYRVAAVAHLARGYIKDDLLDTDEERYLSEYALALGLTLNELRTLDRNTFEDIVIAAANAGRLPEVPPGNSHVSAKSGEVIHAEFPAILTKEVTQREFRGHAQGVSIPLGGGVRYRTSVGRAKQVVVGTSIEPADTGVLAVTSKRAIFVGDRKTLAFDYPKLVAMEQYTDGLKLSVSSRQEPSLLRIPVESSPCLAGALITAASAGS